MVKLYESDEVISKNGVIDMTLEHHLDIYDKSSTSLVKLYEMYLNNKDFIVKIKFNTTTIEAIRVGDALAMICKDVLYTKTVMIHNLSKKLPKCQRMYYPDCVEEDPVPKSKKAKGLNTYVCKSVAMCEQSCDKECPRKSLYNCDINCTHKCRRKRATNNKTKCEPECTLKCGYICEIGYFKTQRCIEGLLYIFNQLKMNVIDIQNKAKTDADILLAANTMITFSNTGDTEIDNI